MNLTTRQAAGVIAAVLALVALAVVLVVWQPWAPTFDQDRLEQCVRVQAIQSTNAAYTPEDVEANYQACREAARIQ